MKPNNAGKPMWLQAQTINEKLKQDAQTTGDVDSMQAISVLNMTRFESISQI